MFRTRPRTESLGRNARCRTLTALAVGFLVTLLFSHSASALDDYVLGSPATGYMPDFDQRREAGPLVFDGMQFFPLPPGLPNDGAMYCVPTASIDVMAYLANHGYPSAMPGGAASWQSQSQYDLVTGAIAEMGVLMETDPFDGTLGKGRSGTQEWLDTKVGPDVFVVDSQFAKNSYGPNMWEIAAAAHGGHLVIVNVGWYEQQPGGQWVREGGHQTVLTGAFENDGFFVDGCQIRLRDPGGGGNKQTQSTFSNRTHTIDYVSGQFSSKSDPIDYSNRTMAQLVGYDSGSRKGFIQGYYKVTPLFGLTNNGLGLDFVNPYPVGPNPLPLTQSFDANGGVEIADFALSPLKTRVYYTVRDASGAIMPQIHCLDRTTGEASVAINALSPQAIAFGANPWIYTIEGQCVNAYDPANPTSPAASQCVPVELIALATDDVHDRIFAIGQNPTGGPGMLYVMDEELTSYVELPLPSVLDLSGTICMTTNPKSGELWVKGSQSSTAYRLEYTPGDVGGLPPAITPTDSFFDIDLAGAHGMECTGREHILLVKNGAVLVFARDAAGGWSENLESPFSGMAAGSKIQLAREVENTDLEYRTDPSHVNLLPDEELALFQRGDCNGDLGFDIADAIATLSFLFTGDTSPACMDACDSNDDGNADIGDAVFSLSALFSGGATPPAPFVDCGEDPTDDTLDCQSYVCP
ncbi:MAG: hypothetical protein AAF488_15645 [Planctomycetota bacterium]